jgi:hypothetical protein
MVDDWKEIYGFHIGSFMQTTATYIGAAIFAITNGDENLTFDESFIFVGYVFGATCALFIPCYFGNVLLDVTDDLSYDLFSSEWVDADMKYKRSMIIFGENLMQPIVLSAWGFEEITLEIFQEVSI